MFVLEEVFLDHVELLGVLVAHTVKVLSKNVEAPQYFLPLG